MTSADVAPQAGKGRGASMPTAAIEAMSARVAAYLAARPGLAALALIALVLALDLAGNIALPPLDRTEVIYAQTAKQMLEPGGPGTWTAPAFQAEPKFEKPLAVLWLQAGGAWLSGEVDQIRGYRVASILATILAVLITFLGARRIFDPRVASVGAALLATMLVVTLQATLAMPEALMLAATCAALFAMGRAYSARQAGDVGPGNALIFWLALGVGVLVNVMTIPLIAVLTALALVAWDRGTAGWLKRLRSWPGMVAFVMLAALWPLVLWQAGTLDAAVAQWRAEGLHLLLGPQEMKWRVLPGLFALFLLLGMFPAGLFLAPSLITAWRNRASPAIRFLIAWIVPYLLFLELFTRKTPLYMVQAMLPPVAVLFALWVMRWKEEGA
ncbi:MAG TPA: glycosyltransferase family 39 protein, partial [Hyphomicrobiaceae bacterium]|nr:glycosyltransferase family 39 protein [Hyphomicrobiaceae bacterium]